MRFSALQENPAPADGDFFPSTDVSDSGKDKKITLANLVTYVRSKLFTQVKETFTYAGLTITVAKTAGCVTFTIAGTLTEELGTKNNYVTLCTLSETFRRNTQMSPLWYIVINGDTIGQVRILSTGELSIGYTKDINLGGQGQGPSKNMAAGVGIFCGASFCGR